MRRLLVIVLVLFSLAFQSLASAGPRAASGEEMSHELLHLHDVPHHHHEGADGEDLLMFDQSAESASHLASDGAFSPPAIAPVLAWHVAAPSSVSPPSRRFALLPDPEPRSLRKPPRLAA